MKFCAKDCCEWIKIWLMLNNIYRCSVPITNLMSHGSHLLSLWLVWTSWDRNWSAACGATWAWVWLSLRPLLVVFAHFDAIHHFDAIYCPVSILLHVDKLVYKTMNVCHARHNNQINKVINTVNDPSWNTTGLSDICTASYLTGLKLYSKSWLQDLFRLLSFTLYMWAPMLVLSHKSSHNWSR